MQSFARVIGLLFSSTQALATNGVCRALYHAVAFLKRLNWDARDEISNRYFLYRSLLTIGRELSVSNLISWNFTFYFHFSFSFTFHFDLICRDPNTFSPSWMWESLFVITLTNWPFFRHSEQRRGGKCVVHLFQLRTAARYDSAHVTLCLRDTLRLHLPRFIFPGSTRAHTYPKSGQVAPPPPPVIYLHVLADSPVKFIYFWV